MSSSWNLSSIVEGKVQFKPALMSTTCLLQCSRQGFGSHPTFMSRRGGKIWARTNLIPFSTILQRRMLCASYTHEQNGWWDVIQDSPDTLLYCTVEEGLACIIPLRLGGRVGWNPEISSHTPQLWFIKEVERDQILRKYLKKMGSVWKGVLSWNKYDKNNVFQKKKKKSSKCFVWSDLKALGN